MTRKRVIIRGEEFILEPISPSVVRVEYGDQVGWIGISRDCDVNNPFAYQSRPPDSLDEGVGSSLTAVPTIQIALRCLSFSLIQAQKKEEALRINPQARRGMAQWALQEFLEGLEDGDEI